MASSKGQANAHGHSPSGNFGHGGHHKGGFPGTGNSGRMNPAIAGDHMAVTGTAGSV